MAFTQNLQGAPADTKPAEQPKAARSTKEWALGLVLVIAGGIGWIAGAKYTLFGWVDGLNILLHWLSLPITVPTPAGWFVLLAIPLGVMYSRVETRIWHRRSATLMRAPLFWLGWLIIVGTDVGSTFLGVRLVDDTAWQIAKQIAANGYVAFVWACVLTFAPEWSILGGVKYLHR